MKKNVTFISAALTLLLSSQAAFAQQAPAQQTATQPTVQTQAVNAPKPAQEIRQIVQHDVTLVKAPITRRKIKVVREAVPGQSHATRTLSRGLVIHRTDLAVEDISVYRPTKRVTSTPNLYRN